VFRRRDFSRYDVVAATEYYLTWAVCLRLLLKRRGPKIVALGLNQSRRLLLSGIGFVDHLLNKVLRRSSLFVVHSKAEAQLFERIHDIPADRFVFCHWGYDLPAHDRSKTELPEGPYVTMIGRNNRDIKTFCAALGRTGVNGVLITAKYMLERYEGPKPKNVLILTDRSMEECLNYVAGSFAHLVLVLDADRGAGHISAVSAMLLGKPQIFSDVTPIGDYLIDSFNGIAVPVGAVSDVAKAILSLRDNPDLRNELGENARRFALAQLSYQAWASRSAAVLEQVCSEKR
jgi:glycosyltransferase involved in cell wall biosynthesis